MEKQIIEINGVKMEVDMRYAKRIEHLQVGSRGDGQLKAPREGRAAKHRCNPSAGRD